MSPIDRFYEDRFVGGEIRILEIGAESIERQRAELCEVVYRNPTIRVVLPEPYSRQSAWRRGMVAVGGEWERYGWGVEDCVKAYDLFNASFVDQASLAGNTPECCPLAISPRWDLARSVVYVPPADDSFRSLWCAGRDAMAIEWCKWADRTLPLHVARRFFLSLEHGMAIAHS